MSRRERSRGAQSDKQNLDRVPKSKAASSEKKCQEPRRKCVLEMSPEEACSFFMKPESYNSLDFPPYIDFDRILGEVKDAMQGCDNLPKKISHEHEGVNYIILNNKDGRYAWRPMELIHPVLYVDLVSKITQEDNWEIIVKRFEHFRKNSLIRCLSLPSESLTNQSDKAEQVRQWWEEVEQESLRLSLEYDFLIHTDIGDCYRSIYTHSIAWALHDREVAKKNKSDAKMTGNVIDNCIQNMRQRQTNGIPQGSVLMDFIAEMVLGYADYELSRRLEDEENYRILRYRDDYRIFANDLQQARKILKELTEVLSGLGLRINSEKTKESHELIASSIKQDKYAWIMKKQKSKDFQKDLLIIYQHGREYPNGGSLIRALSDYYERLPDKDSEDKLGSDPRTLVAIITDIACHHPRTYPVCAAILSKLLSFVSDDEGVELLEKIRRKINKIPSTGHMEIWLQRISLPFNREIKYQENICRIVSGENCELWNNEWIPNRKLRGIIDCRKIINKEEMDKIQRIISRQEFRLYTY